ncbi:hypothetical protein [Streptomyces globosus]|uniref:hypothetical protein n=1 Tax=Streptomyces globosus TaxID=68209 RepID=UPI0013B37FE5|nr:hypothetical protein [Streptomyces globosus]
MSGEPAPLRATRAALFAAVCTALGAAGHALMSGADIPPRGLLAAFAATGALAWLAAGRRRGTLPIGAALLAAQGALHLAFSGTAAGHHHAAAPAAPAPAPAPAPVSALAEPMPGHHHLHGTVLPAGAADPHAAAGADALAAGGTSLADAAGRLADTAGHGGLGMLAAHLLAALLCAAWLARGEAAVFRLAAALGAAAVHAARPLARALALVRARAALTPRPPAPRRPAHTPPRRLRGAVHAHTLVRRGPPRRPGSALDTTFTAPGRAARA